MKEIIRAIIRTATLMTTWTILMASMGFIFNYVEKEVSLGSFIFWTIAVTLTSIKITLLPEDF